MQLDLFEDNRSGILINIANECILAGDLGQAISVYEQILSDSADDKSAAALLTLVAEWRDLLAGIEMSAADLEQLLIIWNRLQKLSHPALRTVVLDVLIDAIRNLPDPEQIFIAPRFHLGQLLMAAGRYHEAADSLCNALTNRERERGKFLAWRGDALTLAGNTNEGLRCYCKAFYEDPTTVDLDFMKSRKIVELLSSLHFDAMDEIGVAEETAWLPVWGWLQGVFVLPLQSASESVFTTAAEFENLIAAENCSLAHIWFDMLVSAERLPGTPSEKQELPAIRRLMKKTHGFMFDRYLEKIRTRK
ncbi:MAG TPA: hypothetical protein HPP94_03170 [Desulfuromonadales bacterium]|nr:hypothetical protein [Desulfuromonadales bacterium]